MPVSSKIIRLLDNIEPGLREVIVALLEEIEKQRLEIITKNEFNELKSIVKELAEAQMRSEERIEKLEQIVEELAEAQKRAADRIGRLEEVVEKLAEAQRRTEERVNELAEAQRKTEIELEKLVGEHRKTREMIGALQHTVGYVLEDRALAYLPEILKKDYRIEIVESLKRDYIELSPRNFVEVNIIGKGKKNGKEVWIIGECKSQLKKKDVDEFLKKLKKIEKILTGEKFPIVVAYQASPTVKAYIEEQGLKIYLSYQFPL